MTERLWVAGILGGLVSIVVLVVLVFQFGIKDPSPPSLQDDPVAAIPGRIAYVDTDSCLAVVDASGDGHQQLSCGFQRTGVAALSWRDQETLLYATYEQNGVEWTAINTATGEETPLGANNRPDDGLAGNDAPDGSRLEVDYDSGDVFVLDGRDRIRIFAFDGPDNAWVDLATWSPDSGWVLLRYSHDEELWIVQRTGEIAGTLVSDANYGPVSWWIDGEGALPDVNAPAD